MIKVLVVDDSFLMRRMISEMLNSDPSIRVVGVAKNEEEALEKFRKLSPDVVTLDIVMQGASGLEILKEIMRAKPTPVIIISAYSKAGADVTIESFEYGAFDFVTKPGGETSLDIRKVKRDLIALVKTAAQAIAENLFVKKLEPAKAPPPYSKKVLVIGASSGGPQAILTLLLTFPASFPIPILVVQHMPSKFTSSFSEHLNRECEIKVKEASEGDKLEAGKALIAPGGWQMGLERKGNDLFITLDKQEQLGAPSIDVTLESVAKLCKEKVIVVILTGIGHDGADGAKKIREEGGTVIAQDKKTSLVYGMPRVVAEEGNADFVLPLEEISKKITELL